MTPADTQRYAVAKLVGYCDGILSSGILGEHVEGKLREQVALTCTEFGMPVEPVVLPPDAHLDSCLLPEVEGALNDDGAPSLPEDVERTSIDLDGYVLARTMERLLASWEGGRRYLFSTDTKAAISAVAAMAEKMLEQDRQIVDLRVVQLRRSQVQR